ncbi:MAG: hypothetical protein WHS64_06860 [Fervidobacterium sp.]|uniref:Outer membrane protein beta-barrel domain-containing protein n=1 Tax=Fervidobacterium gondwanense DSM 13020 TaxID=1121883 RepID=A0A1M7T559_FERGO|nr:hypothetical protein [Fervidobacterium gondwanense]UXF00724.1 hypothetical protein IB67_03920 [Fervidobacterium riparium]SHN65873.1 hypothetical protein SAMN02745226_01554 [Fervidobacterium gondwanense DSM 13020]
MKKFVFLAIVFLLFATSFAFELNSGVLYSFSGQLLYALEFNTLSNLVNGPSTTSGFSLMYITDVAEKHFGAIGGQAKYDINLEIGRISLYGFGGMLFPIFEFGFEKITSIVRVGAKYYIGNIIINSGIYSLYLIDSTKLEGVEFSIGYTF